MTFKKILNIEFVILWVDKIGTKNLNSKLEFKKSYQ